MNDDFKDYRSGLKYFIALMLCLCSLFTIPDGDPLLYKLLGFFGISPGIQLGANSTLYRWF